MARVIVGSRVIAPLIARRGQMPRPTTAPALGRSQPPHEEAETLSRPSMSCRSAFNRGRHRRAEGFHPGWHRGAPCGLDLDPSRTCVGIRGGGRVTMLCPWPDTSRPAEEQWWARGWPQVCEGQRPCSSRLDKEEGDCRDCVALLARCRGVRLGSKEPAPLKWSMKSSRLEAHGLPDQDHHAVREAGASWWRGRRSSKHGEGRRAHRETGSPRGRQGAAPGATRTVRSSECATMCTGLMPMTR